MAACTSQSPACQGGFLDASRIQLTKKLYRSKETFSERQSIYLAEQVEALDGLEHVSQLPHKPFFRTIENQAGNHALGGSGVFGSRASVIHQKLVQSGMQCFAKLENIVPELRPACRRRALKIDVTMTNTFTPCLQQASCQSRPSEVRNNNLYLTNEGGKRA